MSKLLAGIDLGTTALKIAVFDTTGKMLGNATLEYQLYTPKPYFVESDPAIYMDAIEKGFAKLAEQGVNLMDLEAISFSLQSETMFFVDEYGKPLRNSISWMDNRAVEQAEYLTAKYGDELCYEHTGQISFAANWPVAKALWVKQNEPEVFAKTRKILLIEDFIIFQLTGRYVSDCAMLCSTLYWDITTKKYWKPMLEELGMTEENFPEIMEPGEVVGSVLPDIARKLGINPHAKVCTGAMDNAIGAVGVGIFHSGGVGLLLYAVHVFSALVTGLFLSGRNKIFGCRSRSVLIAPLSLSQSLPDAVQRSALQMLTICGFVVTFNVLIGLLDSSGVFSFLYGLLAQYTGYELRLTRALCTGILELGCGIGTLAGAARTPANLAVCGFLTGFGGISVAMQTAAVLAGTKIKISRHFVGRFSSGCIAAFTLYVIALLMGWR